MMEVKVGFSNSETAALWLGLAMNSGVFDHVALWYWHICQEYVVTF